MEESVKAKEDKGWRKPNNAIVIPTSLDTDFFKWWCIYLRPLINLTDREMQVVASFLKIRYELSQRILDPAILDTLVMSNDTKKRVMEDCKITMQHFYVVLSSLRKNKVFLNNTLNPRLIPNIKQDDDGTFQLLIVFKDNNNQSNVQEGV